MAQVSHRERLIEGAMACLQTKGYARTTARDIAAAAGANLASIGYHFGSKEALLTKALIRLFEQRNAYVSTTALGDDDATPLERLTSAFVAVRSLFEPHRPVLVASIEAMAEANRSPELREEMAAHYREMRRGIAAVLADALGPAAYRPDAEADAMASLLVAIFDGLVVQWLLDPAATPTGDQLVAALAGWMTQVLEHEA